MLPELLDPVTTEPLLISLPEPLPVKLPMMATKPVEGSAGLTGLPLGTMRGSSSSGQSRTVRVAFISCLPPVFLFSRENLAMSSRTRRRKFMGESDG